MKRTIFFSFSLLFLLSACMKEEVLPPVSEEPLSGLQARNGKVTICHREGNGDYHSIEVSVAALDAHLAHGDGVPGEPVPGMEGKVFGENCTIEDAGPTVTPGYSDLTEAAGVRYRGNSSGNEIYLGVPDLATGGNRVEASYPTVYTNWQAGTYAVTFSFDAAENKITTSIDGPGGTKSLAYDFDDLLSPGCATTDWNAMDINVVDRRDPFNLRFNNVTLNGNDLGDFGEEGWNNWTVSGFDFSQSFTLSGDLVVEGVWEGSETNKLQIMVGCLP
jgi:hypothetical protein